MLDVGEDDDIVLKLSFLFTEEDGVCFGCGEVMFVLLAESFTGFYEIVVVVKGFDCLLKTDGDEEADDDGGDMDEEVAPGVGGVVRWMDVEHEWLQGIRNMLADRREG